MSKKIIRPFLKHDEDAQNDRELAKIIYKYDYTGYGLYWSVVEFLHKNRTLAVGEEYLIRGYDKHSEIVTDILNNAELFRVENDCYVSDRIMAELDIVENKASQQADAAQIRWLMSDFKKAYESVFEKTPVLGEQEIKNLKKYSSEIPDFKKVLPDIVYTLQFIKFDDKIRTKPLCNWLLTDNNIARVYNGEFGKLKHKKTAKELKAEQQKHLEELRKQNGPSELDIAVQNVTTKDEALALIVENSTYFAVKHKAIMSHSVEPLLDKFGIELDEITEIKRKQHEHNNKA